MDYFFFWDAQHIKISKVYAYKIIAEGDFQLTLLVMKYIQIILMTTVLVYDSLIHDSYIDFLQFTK